MNRDKDFAGNCALEATSRAARILPVLQSYLEIEGIPRLTEVQQIGLCSVILSVFDGITDTLERMSDVNDVLAGFCLGEEAAAFLRSLDES